MTQEEKQILLQDLCARLPNGEPFPARYNSQDWLNAHHFDYRGLVAIDPWKENKSSSKLLDVRVMILKKLLCKCDFELKKLS